MKVPENGFEYLSMLKQQNGKQIQNFSNLSQYLAYKARDKAIPYSGQFELTPLCNFDCRMCYVHLNPEQLSRSVLTVETWKNLLHQAFEAGMCSATLTGGECLAYPGFEEIYLYLHEMGCQAAVLTNGYLLDEKRIRFFREHMPTKIQITLYGWNDDVYERVTGKRAFSRVVENVRKAIEAHLPISLTVTPNDFLGEDIFETVRLAKGITNSFIVNSCLFSPREETGRSDLRANPEDEVYLRIYRLLNELNGRETPEIEEDKLPPYGGPCHECSERGVRCGGGRSAFVVDWKGTMMPCNRLDMIRAYPLEEGFRAAWAKINREANNWPRVPECDGCPYTDVCSNCAANMLRFAEPGRQPIGLCEQTKYFVRHGVRSLPECED